MVMDRERAPATDLHAGSLGRRVTRFGGVLTIAGSILAIAGMLCGATEDDAPPVPFRCLILGLALLASGGFLMLLVQRVREARRG
jgi:hypothetical protein